jgi:predicted  nucleic acid-binding Zn-ribbon protein
MSQQTAAGTVHLSVENIGGIDSCQVTIEPGVTVLSGPNATNRTSLLSAMSAVLGGSFGSLKGDADRGSVTMEMDGRQHTRELHRENGTVRYNGDPFTDRSDVVDLFACLFESNEVRRAVERGEDLRELVMRPVDIEALRAEIRSLQSERDDIEDRLAEIERERDRLPDLRRERRDCEEQLEEITERLRETRADIEAHEADREAATAAQEVVESHQEAQVELTDVREEIETESASLAALRSERADVTGQLDELEEDVDEELAALDSEIAELRDRKHRLGGVITDLTSIVEFNEELLESDGDLPGRSGAGRLDREAETVECWTCGSSVERGDIASRIDQLRELIDDHRADRSELDDRIETLREEQSRLRDVTETRERLSDRRRQIDTELTRREERLEALHEREAALEDRVAELEAKIAETAAVRDSDLLEKYQTVSDLEFERGKIEQELADIRETIEGIQGLADEREELAERRDGIRSELDSLRTRVEDTERAVITEFNDRMADNLELLAYDNIERVWIERTVAAQGAVPDSSFALHVVRTTDEGAVYEDTVDHLSESEREVTGLIVALAGYLAHEVYETVPVVLLDSLEAIDATRIARLLEYMTETVPYLVVALLPEDAAAVDDRHERVPAERLR